MLLRCLLLPSLFFVAASCVPVAHSRTAAQNAAVPALDCPKEQLHVQDLEDDRYRVSGCSRSVVYQCQDERCWREGWLARKAVERATREFGCAEDKVKVRWIQAETYRVEACGQAATYACTDDICAPEGAPTGTRVVPVPILGK